MFHSLQTNLYYNQTLWNWNISKKWMIDLLCTEILGFILEFNNQIDLALAEERIKTVQILLWIETISIF